MRDRRVTNLISYSLRGDFNQTFQSSNGMQIRTQIGSESGCLFRHANQFRIQLAIIYLSLLADDNGTHQCSLSRACLLIMTS